MEKCLIHCFSGTGGTYHAASNLKDKLIDRGCDVTIFNIEEDNIKNIEEYEVHIFMYPIYGFGMPSIMIKYIKKLKIINDLKAAIICTCGGQEGYGLRQACSILEKGGFDVFLTERLIYPSNWTQVFNPPPEKVQKQLIKEAVEEIAKIADKILTFETNLRQENKFTVATSSLVSFLFTFIGRKILGKFYIADHHCISCGRCELSCPSKSIKLKSGRPNWDLTCEACQRCINTCPQKAIQTSVPILIINIIGGILLIPITISITRSFNIYWILDFIAFIILYFSLSILFTIVCDWLCHYLKYISSVRKFFEINFTKDFRRYFIK